MRGPKTGRTHRAGPRVAGLLAVALAAWFTCSAEAGGCDYRVGPGGTSSTIQAAIDAAGSVRGARTICVAAVARHESFMVPASALAAHSDQLIISGGWDPPFVERVGRTPLDVSGFAPAVRIDSPNGRFTLTGFTFTTGSAAPTSAESVVRLQMWGEAHGQIDFNAFDGIRLDQPKGSFGAPLTANLRDTAILDMLHNEFAGNVVTSVESDGHAGAYVNAQGSARVHLGDNLFQGNDANLIFDVQVYGAAEGFVFTNTLIDNRLRGGVPVDPSALVLFSVVDGSAPGPPHIYAQGNIVSGNRGDGPGPGEPGHAQVQLFAIDGGIVRLSSTLVAGGLGSAGGVSALAVGPGAGSTVYATNLTIADNAGVGFSGSGPGSVSLSNSIVLGNGEDTRGAPTMTADLIGEASGPRFADRADGNYRLEFGSPGIDEGNDDPPGGLNPVDLDGLPRVQCGRVDIGAYEAPCVPPIADGPTCRALDWPLDLPFVARDAPACRCVSDPGLREFQCGFLLPDIFLAVHVPLGPPPPGGVPLRWTIDPWTNVSGAYALETDVHDGDSWIPQQWLGPTAKGLYGDQLVIEPFLVKPLEQVATPVRTTITYHRAGLKAPLAATVEILLPAPVGKSAN